MIGPEHPSFSFTRESILANAPAASGVYAIYNPRVWIYVGETGDLKARLLEHLNGDNPCITRHAPTGFQLELCPAQQRLARQNAVILRLNPVCNRSLG